MFWFLFFGIAVCGVFFFCVDCCVALRVLQIGCVSVVCTVKNMAPSEILFACDISIVKKGSDPVTGPVWPRGWVQV